MLRISKWYHYENKTYCRGLTLRDCKDYNCKYPHYDEVLSEPISFTPTFKKKEKTPEPEPREEPVKKKRIVRCGVCGGEGHNKRSCKWTSIIENIKNLPVPVV
jgi:hypothetical protein